MSLQWNGLLNSDAVNVKLEGKDYHSIDMVFPFICAFVDKTTRYTEDGALTKVNICALSCLVKCMRDFGVFKECLMNMWCRCRSFWKN